MGRGEWESEVGSRTAQQQQLRCSDSSKTRAGGSSSASDHDWYSTVHSVPLYYYSQRCCATYRTRTSPVPTLVSVEFSAVFVVQCSTLRSRRPPGSEEREERREGAGPDLGVELEGSVRQDREQNTRAAERCDGEGIVAGSIARFISDGRGCRCEGTSSVRIV